jgi:hypothetical protein
MVAKTLDPQQIKVRSALPAQYVIKDSDPTDIVAAWIVCNNDPTDTCTQTNGCDSDGNDTCI